MRKPACITAAETEETKLIGAKAHAALIDTALTDEQADAIIAKCNTKLTALGMPSGGLTVSRKVWKNLK